NLMQGLELGLLDGAGAVHRAAQAVSAELIHALSGGWGANEGAHWNWIGWGDPRLAGRRVFEDGTIAGMPGWRVPRWEMEKAFQQGHYGAAALAPVSVSTPGGGDRPLIANIDLKVDGETLARVTTRHQVSDSRGKYGVPA